MFPLWDKRWTIDLYEADGRSRRLVKERAKTYDVAVKRARRLKRLVAGNEINVNSPPAGWNANPQADVRTPARILETGSGTRYLRADHSRRRIA